MAHRQNVHRTIHFGDRGPDVKELQHGINHVVGHYEFDWRKVHVDGWWGHHSRDTAILALWAQGFPRRVIKRARTGEIRRWPQRVLRGKHRTPAMRARQLKRRKRMHKLRAEHRKAIAAAKDHDCITIFDGKPCAEWIARDLQEIRSHGWPGYLISGVRTPEYCRELCQAMCGYDSCPGRCAGVTSNHCCPPSFTCKPNEGACDLSAYAEAGSLLRQTGSALHNELPYDRPHYSASGR